MRFKLMSNNRAKEKYARGRRLDKVYPSATDLFSRRLKLRGRADHNLVPSGGHGHGTFSQISRMAGGE